MSPETQKRPQEQLRAVLAAVAPGTPLREGIERILRAETGGLIVLGNGAAVEPVLSGGFGIDEEFTAQRLSELAKMDGAIVIDAERDRIIRANVHLVPDHTIPTAESGTRHRTAERVAKQTAAPVIAVSQSMRTVTLYVESAKRVLDELSALLGRANQAMQTLERYKLRFDEVSAALSALEVEDLATLRDAVNALQRAEMVRRIAGEIDGLVAELGSEGRLLRLQLDELMGGVDAERRLIVRDYVTGKRGRNLDAVVSELDELTPEDLLDQTAIARVLGHSATPEALEQTLAAKGFRLLSKIPRLPEAIVDRIVGRFGRLDKLMSASLDDLLSVEGVGAARATSIKDGLARLAESSILDRYL